MEKKSKHRSRRFSYSDLESESESDISAGKEFKRGGEVKVLKRLEKKIKISNKTPK